MARWGRKTRRNATLAACIVLATALPARAQTEAGNAWLNACLPDNTAGQDQCMTYIAAIADVMRNGNAIYGWFACPPAALPPRQAYDTVMKFMRWRGDLRHYSASATVAHALAAAFPCQPRGK